MAYWDVAALAGDGDFANRCMAAFATEDQTEDPPQWWTQHSWAMAAAPGFGDAYASAVASGVEAPGRDASVITDEQILSAVQAVLGQSA